MTRRFIDEVAPRDGLQREKRFVPLHSLAQLLEIVHAAGHGGVPCNVSPPIVMKALPAAAMQVQRGR